MPLILHSTPTRRARMQPSGGAGEASVYPLELVSPREAATAPSADAGTPDMPSGHRIFKAYPGIEYNIRAVVIGGAYPYTFSLSNAPSGMTINATTGEISWPNPTGGPVTPSVTVTDYENTTITEAWTITVTTSGFEFYATDGNDSTGDGTISSPYQTLGHARSNTANSILYFRAGTYSMSNFTTLGLTADYGGGNLKCGWGPGRGSSVQMLAYPGESVTFDHAYSSGVYMGVMLELEPAALSSTSQPIYLDGITFTNVSNSLLRPTANGSYHHIRRCTFSDVWEPTGGANPAGIMWSQGTLRHYTALQDNVGVDLDHGATCGMYKLYSHKKLLIEDDEASVCGSPFDIKYGCPRFEIRGGWYRDNTYSEPGIVGNQNGASGEYCSGEIRYNRVTCRGNAGGVSAVPALALNNFGNTADVDVYRNTFVGKVWIENTTGTGTFTFKNNVIINDNTTYADRLSYDDYAGTSSLVALGTGDDTNLVGAIGSGIVNESTDLALTGSSRTTYLGQKGHELA